ncbi:MAG TPA: peptidoglycan DD-metalloendopeptidase family protein [Bacteroidales bacterium]|nr:peptidoglycan DD-metalloendopeptidase family protein [Bacteroidales bacterium]HRZ48595.1 peptidoglycan DD-metalloendopeptidase family protein [Bacteroidales bacterium]
MKRKTWLLAVGSVVLVAIVAFLLIFGIGSQGCSRGGDTAESTDSVVVRTRYGIPLDRFSATDTVFPEGAVFGSIMLEWGASDTLVNAWVAKSEGVLDLRKIKAGNPCTLFREKTGGNPLRYFIYHTDPVNYVIFSSDTVVAVTTGALPVDTIVHQYSATITSSLWNTMTDDGKNPELILSLSDVFAWVIDFFGLQEGDRFKVLYDELMVEGKSTGIGTIHAAWFRNNGTDFYAFRYMQEGRMQYFDDQGTSLRREFLKAPLEFRRISSHFSHSRLHPILRRYRPHHGVDYSAAPGTPVRTIGDGTVIDARYAGGAGKMVKVRHNSVYTTVYMHLRGFGSGIRHGSRVKQGDVIGYVGSTGLSTGPHLDFRVYKNGTPINPLKLESPPAKPVHPDSLNPYKSFIAPLKGKLDRM